MNRIFAPVLAVLCALPLAATYGCGDDDDDDNGGAAGSTSQAGRGGAGGSNAAGAGAGGAAGGGGSGGSSPTIARLVATDADLDTLAAIVDAVDPDTQAEFLIDGRTLFAPVNTAFEALGRSCGGALIADPALSRRIVRYHLVTEGLLTSNLREGDSTKATALETATLTITKAGASVTLNSGAAAVTAADLAARNGAVHKIDKLLVPPSTALPEQCRGGGGAGGGGGQGGAGGGT